MLHIASENPSGNFTTMLAESERIQLWLNLKISRQDAESALSKEPEGCFIIRASASRPTDYVLSIRLSEGIRHHQVGVSLLYAQHTSTCDKTQKLRL